MDRLKKVRDLVQQTREAEDEKNKADGKQQPEEEVEPPNILNQFGADEDIIVDALN